VQAETATTVALLGDAAMIVAGLLLGFWLRFRSDFVPRQDTWWTSGDTAGVWLDDYAGLIGFGALMLVVTFLYLGLYRVQNLLRFRRVSAIVSRSLVFWLVAYLGLSLVLKFEPSISRIYVASSALATAATVLSWRAFFHRLLSVETFARHLRQRVLFVGWTTEAARLTEVIHADASHPYDIVGCLPAPGGHYQFPPATLVRQLGDYEELPATLRRERVDLVILADLDIPTGEIIGLTNLCDRELIQFKVIPSYFQILVSGLQLETISGVPILGVTQLPLDRLGNRVLKRTVDIVGALVGLLGGVPIMLFLGIMIYLESPGAVLFRQERVGRLGRRFPMLKLRSMRLGSDKSDHLSQSTLRDDPRLLRIGAFMRKWNLDEVPQFWNVLLGDMSLVGPRPERTFHSERLSFEIPHYNARYACKPGITGWAQVNGLRGEGDLTERVRYDLYYLETTSKTGASGWTSRSCSRRSSAGRMRIEPELRTRRAGLTQRRSRAAAWRLGVSSVCETGL